MDPPVFWWGFIFKFSKNEKRGSSAATKADGFMSGGMLMGVIFLEIMMIVISNRG